MSRYTEEEMEQIRNRSISRWMKLGYSGDEIVKRLNGGMLHNRKYTLVEVLNLCEEIKRKEEEDDISEVMERMNENMGVILDKLQQSITNGDIKANAVNNKGEACKDKPVIHSHKHRMALYHSQMAKKIRDEKEKKRERAAANRDEAKSTTDRGHEPQNEQSCKPIISKAAAKQMGIEAICDSAIKLTGNKPTLNLIVLDPKTGDALEVSARKLLPGPCYDAIRSSQKRGENLIMALYFYLKSSHRESRDGSILPKGFNSLGEFIASLDRHCSYATAWGRLQKGFTIEQATNPLPREAALKGIQLPAGYKTLEEFCKEKGVDKKIFKHELKKGSVTTWDSALERTKKIQEQKKK